MQGAGQGARGVLVRRLGVQGVGAQGAWRAGALGTRARGRAERAGGRRTLARAQARGAGTRGALGLAAAGGTGERQARASGRQARGALGRGRDKQARARDRQARARQAGRSRRGRAGLDWLGGRRAAWELGARPGRAAWPWAVYSVHSAHFRSVLTRFFFVLSHQMNTVHCKIKFFRKKKKIFIKFK